MTKQSPSTLRKSLRTAGLVGALVLSGVLFAAPAEARGRDHHRGHGHHVSRHHGHGHGHGHGRAHARHDRIHRYRSYDVYRAPRYRGHVRFVVPSHIQRRYVPRYRDYHYGRAYYRPHSHHHEIYHFPVWTGESYAYRPHYYCEGRLFVGGGFSVSGRHFSLRVGF